MDNETNRIAKDLATNLRDLRLRRGLSQLELAERSGLPRSTISNFESGAGNPSLHNLVKLAFALQISIEELLSCPRVECQYIPAIQIPIQLRQNGLIRISKLLPDKISGTEIDRVELKAGARMGGVPHLGGTKEYFFCEEGAIQVTVAGKKIQMSTGDVLAFQGDQAHSYLNSGSSTAIGFSVVILAPMGV